MSSRVGAAVGPPCWRARGDRPRLQRPRRRGQREPDPLTEGSGCACLARRPSVPVKEGPDGRVPESRLGRPRTSLGRTHLLIGPAKGRDALRGGQRPPRTSATVSDRVPRSQGRGGGGLWLIGALGNRPSS